MSTDGKVSEVVFDILILEIINYLEGQHSIQPYLDAGLDPHQANDIIQRLIADKLLTMGDSVGRRLTLKLLDNDPKSTLQHGDNSPYRFISQVLWTYLFGKQTDYCAPIGSTSSITTIPSTLGPNASGIPGGPNQGFLGANSNLQQAQQNQQPTSAGDSRGAGGYIIRENSFRWFQRFSINHDNIHEMRPYTWFASGIIRGALASMGINAEVTEEVELRKEQVYIIFKIEEVVQVNEVY